MSSIKKYGKRLLLIMIEILILLFLLTIPYYFNWISDKTYATFKMILLLGCILLNSFFLGRESSHKGYMEGFRLGILIILLFGIPTFLFSKWQIKILLYDALILTSSTLGSMIGISNKKSK